MQKEEFSFTYTKILEFDSLVWGHMSQLDGKTVKAIYNQKPELFAQKPVRRWRKTFSCRSMHLLWSEAIKLST